DEDVHAAHPAHAGVDGPGIVIAECDVGTQSDRTGLLRDGVDEILLASGEHDLVARLPRQFDDGGADPLAAAGDEKTTRLHRQLNSLRRSRQFYNPARSC